MTPRRLRVAFATFPYGGNGQTAKEHPDIRNWLLQTVYQAVRDERIESVDVGAMRWIREGAGVRVESAPSSLDFCDTPITMTRNAAVVEARRRGIDVLVMVDSDQNPDMYLGIDPFAIPFWSSGFDFLYRHWEQGPSCVGAPYMGGPPHENVFVFTWQNFQSDHPGPDQKLRQYTREEAFQMEGIQECAALPTGLIMFDVRLFDIVDPARDTFKERVSEFFRPLVGQPITPELAGRFCQWAELEKFSREQSWFYYEYTDHRQHEKASTEDVTATRDISLIGCQRLGYNPVYCNWSAWAGHHKTKCVGKPMLLTARDVSGKFARAVQNVPGDRKWIEIGNRATASAKGHAPDSIQATTRASTVEFVAEAVAGGVCRLPSLRHDDEKEQ